MADLGKYVLLVTSSLQIADHVVFWVLAFGKPSKVSGVSEQPHPHPLYKDPLSCRTGAKTPIACAWGELATVCSTLQTYDAVASALLRIFMCWGFYMRTKATMCLAASCVSQHNQLVIISVRANRNIAIAAATSCLLDSVALKFHGRSPKLCARLVTTCIDNL